MTSILSNWSQLLELSFNNKAVVVEFFLIGSHGVNSSNFILELRCNIGKKNECSSG